MLLAQDSDFWTRYKPEFQGIKYTSAANVARQLKGYCMTNGVHLGNQWNSGFTAIKFAEKLGASQAILLGMDGGELDGKKHFFGDHLAGMHNATRWQDWHYQARNLQRELTHIQVINCSMRSRIDAWPKVALDDALVSDVPRQTYYVRGMSGMGDNIMQRPAIKALAEKNDVYLETPWPQIYKDLKNVYPVYAHNPLRTQQKNAERFSGWYELPKDRAVIKTKRISYVERDEDFVSALAAELKVKPRGPFDLPDFGKREGNYVVVRPNTLRSEWRADARSPKPEYIAKAAQAALDAGFDVISVADLAKGQEWLDGEEPPATTKFHAGELGFPDLMALIAGAKGVIGGVGWAVCAASAYNVPMLLFFGGWGRFNSPQKILSPHMNLEKITAAVPSRLCMCNDRNHECKKEIENVDSVIENWVKRLEMNNGS